MGDSGDSPAPNQEQLRAAALFKVRILHAELHTFDSVNYGIALEDCSQAFAERKQTTANDLQSRAVALLNEVFPYQDHEDFKNEVLAIRDILPRLDHILTRLDIGCQRRAQMQSQAAIGGSNTGLYMLTEDEPPMFDGSIGSFHQWFNAFQRLVDQNPRYPVSKKFKILIQSLQGDARTLVGNPLWDEESYKATIKRLKDEYSDNSRCRKLLKDKIRNIQPPKDSHRDLKRFLIEWRNGMEQFKIATTKPMADSTSVELLKELVPASIKGPIYVSKGSKEFTTEELITALEQVATCHLAAEEEMPQQALALPIPTSTDMPIVTVTESNTTPSSTAATSSSPSTANRSNGKRRNGNGNSSKPNPYPTSSPRKTSTETSSSQ